MFFKKKYTKNVAKIYECPVSGDKFSLIAINGDMKDKLLRKFKETFEVQGDHINTGGKASELCIPTLLASGGGALGITAATSGTLFMATANPATLMVVKNGVGSAVMGSGGIVAQAPFIPMAGALMPVVAPLLAFQVLSTIMILQKFESINEKLVKLGKDINRVLQRNEATFIGEVISAYSRLEILEKECEISSRFTYDMTIRLALIEDKINPIFERYKYLYDIQKISDKLTYEDLGFKQSDAYMAIVLSILDLRIAVLRIKLTIQENPGFLKLFAESIVKKVEHYQTLWENIENCPKEVDEISQSIKRIVLDMNIWQKNMPLWIGGKSKERKELVNKESTLSAMNSYKELVDAAKVATKIGDSLTEKTEFITLLYWEDEYGKHSYYTNDVMIR